jgi:hypothetical protein
LKLRILSKTALIFALLPILGVIPLLCGGTEGAAPARVVAGTYLNQISSIDLRNNAFNVDFYVWFRWDDDALKPIDTFELANGRITSKTSVVHKKIGTTNYASARITATVTKFWDMSRFPLDRHELVIEIEDGDKDSTEMVYVADDGNIAISPEVQVPGWTVERTSHAITQHVYNTNYGDTSLGSNPKSTYSRYRFATEMRRPGYGRPMKAFIGLLVSVVVSYLGFYIRPKELGPRLSLGVGAVFAASAASYSISSMLPESNSLTMADRLMIATLTCVTFSFIGTIISLRLSYRGADATSERFDRFCRHYVPPIYAVFFAITVAL